MGNSKSKHKSQTSCTHLTNPLLSFIKSSSSNNKYRGNRTHYLNFIFNQQIYESDLMKSIDSNEILDFVGNILSSMNSQVLSRKFNSGIYLSLFADIMKEITVEEENEPHNIFGFNVFVKSNIIYHDDSKQMVKMINEDSKVEFLFKFGNIPNKKKYINKQKKDNDSENREITDNPNKPEIINKELDNSNNDINKNSNIVRKKEIIHDVDNDNYNKDDQNNKIKKEKNIENEISDTHHNNRNVNNEDNNNDIYINDDNSNKSIENKSNNDNIDNIIIIKEPEPSTPPQSSNENHHDISNIQVMASEHQMSNNIYNSFLQENLSIKEDHKQNIPISNTFQSDQKNNIQTTNNVEVSEHKESQISSKPPISEITQNKHEFEINLNSIDINNSNTFIKNDQTLMNNSISINNHTLHSDINSTYDKINKTFIPKSKLTPIRKKQIPKNKKYKHNSNKNNDNSSIKSTPLSTVFKIDIKDLMKEEKENTFINQSKNTVNEYSNTKTVTQPKMTMSSFMECLDKFLGFDRSYIQKKNNMKLVEIKHRPYNKYSYFSNNKETITYGNRFNTLTGRKLMNETLGNNISYSMIDKRQNSFAKVSELKRENNDKKKSKMKKKEKEKKKELQYEFGEDFFGDDGNKKEGKRELDYMNKYKKGVQKEDDVKENFDLSDSEEYLSARSSYISKED